MSYTGSADNSIAPSAINVLLTRQQGNGSWNDGNNESSVYLTALAARALLPFKGKYTEVIESLSAARNFLLSRRDSSGTWATEFESAQALLTLAGLVADTSTIKTSADALTARQNSNGSWNNDVYTTAIAVRALWRYQARNSNGTIAGKGTITGHVVKAGTGEPIADATISLASSSGISVISDADGFFVLTGIEPGERTVLAEKQSYTSASSLVSVYSGQTSSIDRLILGSDQLTSIISGRVIDDISLQGVEGVKISLSGTQNYTISSDTQGNFEILAVKAGQYDLSIQKTSYYALNGNPVVTAGQNLTINQRLIKEGAFLDPSPADLKGRVIDASTNQPIEGVTFTLDNGTSTTTGSDGRFTIPDLARDTSYQATLSHSAYAEQTLSILFASGANGVMETLVLHALDGSIANDKLSLFGTVIDGVSSEPVAVIKRIDNGDSWTTDAQGQFTMLDLIGLDIPVTITATNYQSSDFTLAVSGFGELNQQFVLPPSGSANSAAYTTLAGTVKDKITGAALSDVQLAIEGTGIKTVSDNAGNFQLSAIDLLEFSVTASAIDYLSSTRPVKLAAHGEYQINPKLQPRPDNAVDLFQIISLSQPQTAVPANTVMLFKAQIANLSIETQETLIVGEIYNANGESVAKTSPYAAGTEEPQSRFSFSSEEVKQLTVPWHVQQLPAGNYRLVLRLIELDTVSQNLPEGVVLTELSSYGDIINTSAIAGSFSFNPPLTQAGSQTPVSLSALVLNKGNTALDETNLTLTLTDPETEVVIHSATAKISQVEVGNHQLVSFGEWIADAEGNLVVKVSAADAAVNGLITGVLYVGDKASGTNVIKLIPMSLIYYYLALL